MECSLSLEKKKDSPYQVLPLFIIHVKINSVGVGLGNNWLLTGRWRTATALRTAGGSHEAHWGTSLTLQFRHGICAALIIIAFAFFACLGLLLAPGNGLRCNEVDVGAVDSVRKLVICLMVVEITYLY